MAKAKTTAKKPAARKAATTKAAAPKTEVMKRGDQAPEAQTTTKQQQDAASKLFQDADKAALLGMPEGLTAEQRENQVRRSALGY